MDGVRNSTAIVWPIQAPPFWELAPVFKGAVPDYGSDGSEVVQGLKIRLFPMVSRLSQTLEVRPVHQRGLLKSFTSSSVHDQSLILFYFSFSDIKLGIN